MPLYPIRFVLRLIQQATASSDFRNCGRLRKDTYDADTVPRTKNRRNADLYTGYSSNICAYEKQGAHSRPVQRQGLFSASDGIQILTVHIL